MRGRSSKQETKEGMELDSKLKDDQPHLSGAYIRSLVKQLTSSRTKDPMNPKGPDCVDGDVISGENLTKFGEGISETPHTQQPQQPQQHKKQVRRRLHTSRPYQERLLNMAEARREIVTALKFHRAAMKQAGEQQQQEQQQEQQSQPLHLSTQPCFEHEGKLKSRRNTRIYPSNTDNFSNYLDNFSYSPFSCAPPPSNPCSWPTSQVPPTFPEALNFILPNQALGLNLNLHDFNNLDTTLFHNSNIPSNYSFSFTSQSSSSSPPLSVVTEDHPSAAISQDMGGPPVTDVLDSCGGSGLHPALDDEEMAEIRSIGEQHQIEWNDKMNLVTSAWWFKFLKTMELGPEEMKVEDDGFHPFDEVMEFPAWLNANDSCLQQHFNYYCPEDYFQDPALPCMDIGEFEGMDSEWLS